MAIRKPSIKIFWISSLTFLVFAASAGLYFVSKTSQNKTLQTFEPRKINFENRLEKHQSLNELLDEAKMLFEQDKKNNLKSFSVNDFFHKKIQRINLLKTNEKIFFSVDKKFTKLYYQIFVDNLLSKKSQINEIENSQTTEHARYALRFIDPEASAQKYLASSVSESQLKVIGLENNKESQIDILKRVVSINKVYANDLTGELIAEVFIDPIEEKTQIHNFIHLKMSGLRKENFLAEKFQENFLLKLKNSNDFKTSDKDFVNLINSQDQLASKLNLLRNYYDLSEIEKDYRIEVNKVELVDSKLILNFNLQTNLKKPIASFGQLEAKEYLSKKNISINLESFSKNRISDKIESVLKNFKLRAKTKTLKVKPSEITSIDVLSQYFHIPISINDVKVQLELLKDSINDDLDYIEANLTLSYGQITKGQKIQINGFYSNLKEKVELFSSQDLFKNKPVNDILPSELTNENLSSYFELSSSIDNFKNYSLELYRKQEDNSFVLNDKTGEALVQVVLSKNVNGIKQQAKKAIKLSNLKMSIEHFNNLIDKNTNLVKLKENKNLSNISFETLSFDKTKENNFFDLFQINTDIAKDLKNYKVSIVESIEEIKNIYPNRKLFEINSEQKSLSVFLKFEKEGQDKLILPYKIKWSKT
ncbi:conserved hypothetical protein [Mycoplasmopsis pulmonis]|uniref:Lipoprotein-associated type-17 domain-containing protein n=1 Tax=Mycoplasmopsis pulmonis (strain UAB CTIP) TaxID=272635 RepID=Q98PP9_MYCPU|nr:lipoprotein 17-related variable surface protein [Mycoplasmopsis pulmonis]MDZ7293690.1 lipoprotein 17-related variable surface protein [Mycoplasmopsis pulmonis]CAC13843.1 conserved hypothetical protein [Mycoplasmopsis pulmonis]